MELEQRFTLPAAPAQAWAAFHDVPLLVDCLPGAALTGPAVDGELPLRFDVKLGPIAAGFVGSGRVSFDEAARSGRFEGAATDRRTNSRVKGAAVFDLQAAAEGGTAVTVKVDYSLSGSLAQFGRGGIVRELAAALTAQFAGNLRARLQVTPAASLPVPPPETAQATEDLAVDNLPAATEATAMPAVPTPPVVAPPPTTLPAPAAPLRVWPLLWQALKSWARRLVGRPTDTPAER